MAYGASQLLRLCGGLLGVAAGWSQITASGSAPSARHAGVAVVDSSDRLWIYGGKDPADTAEVWRLDTVTPSWTQVSVTGSVPPARSYHTAVVDSNDVMWIFGGITCCSTYYNAVFTLNTATEVWAEVTATGSSPTARQQHTAVMDSSDRMWVFGGELSNTDLVNEVYFLDTLAENWAQVSTSGIPPSPRVEHVAVMDSSNRMWIFGGADADGISGGLHVLDTVAATWTTVVAANTPDGRQSTQFVAGSAEIMWIWSGTNGANFLADLRYLGPGGEVWTEVTTGAAASARKRSYVARDSQNRMWLFGGFDVSALSDLWYLQLQGTTTTMSTSSSTKTSSTATSSTSSTGTTSSSNTATSSSSSTTSSYTKTSSSSTFSSTTTSSTSTSTSSSSAATTSFSSTTTSSTATSSSSSSAFSSTTTSSTSTSTSRSSAATSGFSSTTTSSTATGSTSSTTSLSTTTSSTSSSSSTTSSLSSTLSPSSSTTSSSSATMGATLPETGGNLVVAKALEVNVRSLVTQLSSDNVSTALTPLGTMTAVKLTDQSPESGFAMVSHTIDSSTSTALIPTETLQNGSYGFLVITSFNGEMGKDLMGKGVSAASSAGNPLIFATDAVDVSWFSSDLSVVHVTSAEPIFIKLSMANPEPSLFCAYQLPDGSWSTEGVRWATAEELEQFRGVDTSGAWCATSHLSIFAIFVDVLLDCTNINVLSPENMREIIERPDWWTRPPSLCLWSLSAVLLLVVAAGVMRDDRDLWQAKFFFTETSAFPQASCCRCRCGCARRNKSQRPSPDMLAAMQALKKMLPYNKLQESILCQNALREASLQHGLHTNFIEEHIWGAEGWVQGSLALQKSTGLKAVALRVKDNLPSAYVKVHTSRLRCWFSTFVSTNPLFEMHQFDLHLTAAKRAKIFMDCILGSLAFVALFFSVDGSAVAARSPEDCPVEQTSFLWLTFVASFSIFLNFIPRSLFQCLGFRRFVHVDSPASQSWNMLIHHFQDVRFWILGSCLTALHMLIIMAFLANLDPSDEWKWLFSLTLVVVRKLLLVPLLACTISGIVSEIGGVWKPQVIVSPPKKFGLNFDDLHGFGGFQAEIQDEADKSSIWSEKVRELAGRGLTLRQLLDFYADLVCHPQMMPHFDPNFSTTHDVVWHAIIPSSMRLGEARTFVVQVHRAVGLECSPCCVLCVCRQHGEPLLKPWKRGGSCGSSLVGWGETVLLQDVLPEEGLYFAVRLVQNQARVEEEVFCILPSSSFWYGSRETDIRLGAGALVASVVPCDSLGEACDILESGDIRLFFKGDPENMEEHAINPVPLAISIGHSLVEHDAQDEGRSKGFAYATSINGGRPCLAHKMVTHSWGNKFCHLISAIFSDALEEETYDMVAQLLISKDFEGVSARLQQKKKLDIPYWVCAFSVNQHAGICARVPPYDSRGYEFPICRCTTAKHFEGDLSEMNKFDDMMAFLKQHHRQKSQVHLEQVVAMEVDFALLTRVWCVAELAEADKLHLHQSVKTHSASSREKCVDKLLQLDVREAQASFPADKDLVLSKIEDVNVFNRQLQGLMLQRLGTFLAMNRVTASAAAVLDDALGAALSILTG